MFMSDAMWVTLSLLVMVLSVLTQTLVWCFRAQVIAGFGVMPTDKVSSYARISGSAALALWTIFYLGVEVFLVLFPLAVIGVSVVDTLYKRYVSAQHAPNEVVAFCHENALLLLAIFFVRYFVIQHYRVPTGSLEPTVHVGDFILVNQFAYGVHVPLLNTKLLSYGAPKRGDIAVFRYPRDPYRLVYVKRVVGLPGDHIVYRNKRLQINGEVQAQKLLGEKGYSSHRMETLDGVEHAIYVDTASYSTQDEIDLVVPEGHYFMMGDNRDNSADSRTWGPVSESMLVGQGTLVLFEWSKWLPDFSRSGTWL